MKTKDRRPVRRVVQEDAPDMSEIEESLNEPTAGQMEAAEKLADFQSRFGGQNYKVRVEKWHKEDAEWEGVCNAKLDGFDPMVTLRPYGGGRYRLSLLDSGSRYVEGGRQEIRLAEVLKPEEAEIKASPMQDPGVQALIAMLQSQAAQNADLLKTFISAQSSKPAEQPLTELVAAIGKLQGLVPKEADSLKGVKDALELMNAAKELMPEKAETSGGGILSEIKDALSVAKELGPMLRTRQGQPQPRPAPVGGTQIVRQNPQSEPTPAPADPIGDCVMGYVPVFLNKAKRQVEPKEAADFLVAEVYEQVIPTIIENYKPGGITLDEETIANHLLSKAKDQAEVDKIFQIAPVLTPHKEWVYAVVNEAVKIVSEEGNTDAQSPDSPPQIA